MGPSGTAETESRATARRLTTLEHSGATSTTRTTARTARSRTGSTSSGRTRPAPRRPDIYAETTTTIMDTITTTDITTTMDTITTMDITTIMDITTTMDSTIMDTTTTMDTTIMDTTTTTIMDLTAITEAREHQKILPSYFSYQFHFSKMLIQD